MSGLLPRVRLAALLLVSLGFAGCQTITPYDYTNFHEHPPRSILILPPLNQSTAVEATYGYLSTVTRPVAERGYYVYPVAVIDRLLKENGMPSAGEMHQVPLAKVREITGADAVLYPVVRQYGTKFHLISSDTIVSVSARLVDTRTGTLIWEGEGVAERGSGQGQSLLADVIGALVTQVIAANSDPARNLCRVANVQLFTTTTRGLPYGPYHPEAGKNP